MSARGAALLGTALLAAGGLASGCGRPDDQAAGPVLTVYASVPLAGPSAPVGRDVLAGERLALAQAGGRVGANRIRLVVLGATDPDTRRTTPAQVGSNARRAARDPSTIAYLGEVDPAASAVSVVILNEKGILELSPADTFAGLTERGGESADEPAKFYPTGRHTFARLVPDDHVVVDAMLDRLARRGERRVALLDDDGLYGRSFTQEVAAAAPRRGLRVVGRLRLDGRPRPLGAVLGRLRPSRPDAVIFAGAPAPGVRGVWRTLHAELPRARLLASPALAVPAFFRRLGAAGRRTEIASPGLPLAALGPSAFAFAHAFARRFGRAAGPWAPFGYETMRTLLAAARRAGRRTGGARDRRRVAAAALTTRMERSPLGPYVLSGGRTSRRAIGFFSVQDGALTLVARRPPAG